MKAQAASASPSVFMNSGGAAAAAAASSSGNSDTQLRPFGHIKHILLSIVTLGWWAPVWLLLYLFRNKQYYY